MLAGAEKYKGKSYLKTALKSLLTTSLAEDEAETARIQAKNGLESHMYTLCNTLRVNIKLPDESSEIAAPESKID